MKQSSKGKVLNKKAKEQQEQQEAQDTAIEKKRELNIELWKYEVRMILLSYFNSKRSAQAVFNYVTEDPNNQAIHNRRWAIVQSMMDRKRIFKKSAKSMIAHCRKNYDWVFLT